MPRAVAVEKWPERTGDYRKWEQAAQRWWRFAIAHVRVGGCFALQIEGRSFSDVIVVAAILQP